MISRKDKKIIEEMIKETVSNKETISIDEMDNMMDNMMPYSLQVLSEVEEYKNATKTYGVILQNSDIALYDEKIEELTNTIIKQLSEEKFWVASNYTPYNSKCKFSLVIYAIDRNEKKCEEIIKQIQEILKKMNYKFEIFDTEIRWDRERVFIEINRDKKRSAMCKITK